MPSAKPAELPIATDPVGGYVYLDQDSEDRAAIVGEGNGLASLVDGKLHPDQAPILVTSVAGLSGVVGSAALKIALALNKNDVSLENVDNTADLDKPVSTAQAAADTASRARANHTGTQTKATISDLETLAAGTFTPALTNVLNVSSSSVNANGFRYIRLGNVVHVTGSLSITPSAANVASEIGISLPIASTAFSSLDGCSGVAARLSVMLSGCVVADDPNDRARISWKNDSDTSARTWTVSFSYNL